MDRAESQRLQDINGWFEVKQNPLSKVGIFDYSGAQIGAPASEAGRIYRVYRPAEELGRAETLESFKLAPFIDDHTMLGEGFTPAEKVGVSGVIGQDVVFEGNTLFGNVKVYSKALAEKIKNGKTELSCGYRCRYDFTPGVWNGQQYDVVQRDIRGNHLALVDEGRMGPEVAILDHLTFAVDAKELEPVDEELKKLLEGIMARLDKLEAKEPEVEVIDEEAEKAKAAADEEAAAKAKETADAEEAEKAKAAAADADDDTPPATLDAALKQIASLKGTVKALGERPAMDERALVDITARRTSLVDRLTKHVGTFDHAEMTVDEIAAYGVAKLDIKGVAKGSEAIALDAFLQARPDPKAVVTTAADAKPSGLAARVAKHSPQE